MTLCSYEVCSVYVYALSVPAEIAHSDYVSNLDVLLNESIKLYCDAGGLPRPRVAWYFDSTPPVAVDNATHGVFLLDDGWTLYVDAARLSHAGQYSCRAVNVAGDDEKLFNLTVLGQSWSSICSVQFSSMTLSNMHRIYTSEQPSV